MLSDLELKTSHCDPGKHDTLIQCRFNVGTKSQRLRLAAHSRENKFLHKIIVTVYKCIHRLAPNSLSSILTTRTRDNRLRQKQVCHELNTHSSAKLVGKQAFGTHAPELWNKLPLNIRTIRTLQSFKHILKTHLFQSAYRLH